MSATHIEKAFEDVIEDGLLKRGWTKGSPGEFDRVRAICPKDFLKFIEATQTKLITDLRQQHGAAFDAGVIDALTKHLDTLGSLDALRRGIKFYGKKIQCAYFKPSHGMNYDTLAQYARNRLVVTRQVHFAPENHPDEAQSVDLMLSVNGIPVATAELKNHLTGQDVRHAVKQYKARDHRHKLFEFKKRALVHFAVDPDYVRMATKLAGEGTFFLPFDRGNTGGAGNPPHPSGHRTAYLWEEVWQKDSFLDILGQFMHLQIKEEEGKDGKKVTKETLIFPRYHQLDVVRKLVATAAKEGAGKRYLIQHSAGSGKSNSIAWLAHRLCSLHDTADERVFDTVIVVTDRKILDKQLQDNIYQFERQQGVVVRIDKHSDQLVEALTSGSLIVITTLQKFPVVAAKIAELPNRRYAVIVDEAHSSQSGESARKMKEVLAAHSLEEAEADEAEQDEDEQDRVIEAVMASRGPQKNISHFAFTATPKAKTLEVFGRPDAEGKPRAFHLYTMRQAIEERFILDVLLHYTTYKTYYKLVKAIEEDPRVPKKEATRQLARFMSLHPHNISQKTEVMVEHFRKHVRPKIGGKAKAMVVTSSRLHAVRYRQAFDKYIKEQGYGDIGVLVAFSGTVKDPETALEFTEPGMNKDKHGKSIPEARLRDTFKTDDYQLLLVANKYQTGFDQPLLHTMYVDKRLAGVQAVQTLSRLNRTHPGKEETFVLDFVNDAEEIQRSFQPYFEQTTVAETADPQQLYELSNKLEAAQVFWHSEVEAFCKVFYKPNQKQSSHDNAEMYRHLTPGVDRFKALAEAEQDEFRNAIGAYVRLYSFLSQVMPFQDPDLEKLYTFCRFFQTKLPHDPKKAPLQLDGDVALRYYRIDKIAEAEIKLTVNDGGVLRSPTEVGTRQAKEEEASLSEIIEVLNERFGAGLTEAHRIFVDGVQKYAATDPQVVDWAKSNSLENFLLPLRPRLADKIVDLLDSAPEFAGRYLNEPEFQELAFKMMGKAIYDAARSSEVAREG